MSNFRIQILLSLLLTPHPGRGPVEGVRGLGTGESGASTSGSAPAGPTAGCQGGCTGVRLVGNLCAQ